MAIFNTIERAERTHAADNARVAAIRAEVVASETRETEGAAFEELVARDDELAALRRKLIIAEGVAAASGERLATARAEEAERQADAAHKAAQRLATDHAKLLREIFTDSEKLAAKLNQHAAIQRQIRAANEVRGSRPYIVDGEITLRQRMDGGTKAITEDVEVSVDAEGNRVPEMTPDPRGLGYIKNPACVGKAIQQNVLRQATPPMPLPFERLADAVRLIDIDGKTIWPPR